MGEAKFFSKNFSNISFQNEGVLDMDRNQSSHLLVASIPIEQQISVIRDRQEDSQWSQSISISIQGTNLRVQQEFQIPKNWNNNVKLLSMIKQEIYSVKQNLPLDLSSNKIFANDFITTSKSQQLDSNLFIDISEATNQNS